MDADSHNSMLSSARFAKRCETLSYKLSPKIYDKNFKRHKGGKTATEAAIGVGRRWPSYPMHSSITYGNGRSLKVLFRRENARCHNQNVSLQ